MGLDKSLKKILIIGSGPIIIGQAAEFDYSGTQACRSIREEGIKTVLVNSNPATIMTDTDMADEVYIEPLTVESLESIIARERPDGILAGFGGQTALNLAMKLKDGGILDKYNTRLLGINSESIKKAEDREEFKKLMIETGQPVPQSIIATKVEECVDFVKKYGFPVIIRPAYTLGGTGGGFAKNYDELNEVCLRGIEMSPIHQILLEQSVAGWKEIEYEVVRDSKDNCIVICNMENVDPVGIHTGDSIVTAPSQTLRDTEYQMLRRASIDIIRSLKIEGGCNVQFALDPESSKYIVIEVNPRVSRSSALASKATGYPIAKIASKIAIGYTLNELKNPITGVSSACFEPALDYVVVKIPKWPFNKFQRAERRLGTQMKATGEVMAISRTFESALLKAVDSLDFKLTGLRLEKFSTMDDGELLKKIENQDDERIFAMAEALRRGTEIKKIHKITKIDLWFLRCIKNITDMERTLQSIKIDKKNTAKIIYDAEAMGFADEEITILSGLSESELKKIRDDNKIYPVYKIVDTCGGEFDAKTPYYYSCYDDEDENVIKDCKKVIIIGSGPIRIGQGIEFDYCCVHGVWEVKNAGYSAIMINNNPETVSTDFDIADKLYFEPLTIDNVMNVIRKENPVGVIVQFGGQTAINLSEKLSKNGVKILGTDFKSIDLAEDREKFREFLENLGIPSPKGGAAATVEEAVKVTNELGYPVIVRPSYVIGGRAMEVVYDEKSLKRYMKEAVELSSSHPVLIDKYIKGTEIEVDCISDGENVLMPGIMEHVERTGIHSGDSITMYPYRTLKKDIVQKLISYTKKIAKGLNTHGLMNIQYVSDGKNVYVIEVNPRASRTVPILSKVTDVPMIKIAVEIMLGKKLTDFEYGCGLIEKNILHAVKVPVFSGEKLADADMYLSPEMKSTGEVLGIDEDFNHAVYKGFAASGVDILTSGNMYVSLKDVDFKEAVGVIKKYEELGFNIYASEGTGEYLLNNGMDCKIIGIEDAINKIGKDGFNIVLNTPTRGNNNWSFGFKLRQKAAEHKIPMLTCLDTARAYITAIEVKKRNEKIEYKSLNEYLKRLP